MRRWTHLLAAAALVGAGLGLGTAASAAAAPPGAPAFTPPVALGGGGGEPSIRNPLVGQKAAAYISAPSGLGSNFWTVDEVANSDGTISLKGSPPQQPDFGTGGGDSEISVANSVDPVTGCARIAYSGLHNIDILNGFTVTSSTDCGKSFTSPPNFLGVQNTLTDRQWQTGDGNKTHFLIYHTQIPDNQIVVARSLDGGNTYTSFAPVAGIQGVIDGPTRLKVSNSNQIGNIVTDYSSAAGGSYSNGDPKHVLYAIFGGPRSEADNVQAQVDQNVPGANYNHVDTIYMGKSTDGGATWVDTPVYSTPPDSTRELNLLFPVVAVDSAGNLYAAWSDGLHVQYATSTDHGATWSKAFQVNTDNPSLGNGGSADIFPWMVGGDDGRVDLVWYHGQGGAAGTNTTYRDPGDKNTVWTVAFAQLFGAHTLASGVPTPTYQAYSTAVSPVLHKGDICNNGLGCDLFGGDRTLLDFFQDSVDANGCANVAYAADLANPGTSTINYIRQNGGSSLFANATCAAKVVKPLVLTAGSACPGPQVLDPYGDAKGSLLIQPEGGNVDTSDIGSVTFAAPDATHLKITMKVKNLSAQPPDGTLSEIFDVYWTYQGKTYFVEANENPPGLVVYSDGTAEEGRNNATGSPAGAFNTGPDGTIVWTLDRKDVGNPPNGAALTGESAESHAGFRALGTGVSYRATIDRAPDFGSGTTYVVGACTPAIGGIDGTANPPSNGTGTNQGGSGTAGNGSGGSQTSARGTGASLAATGTGPMLPAAGLLVLVLAGLARRRWTHPRTDGVRR